MSLQLYIFFNLKTRPLKWAESNVRLTDNLDQTELEYENRQLRRQVQEMENFLADYGLIWVGTNEDDETESVDSVWGHLYFVHYFDLSLGAEN